MNASLTVLPGIPLRTLARVASAPSVGTLGPVATGLVGGAVVQIYRSNQELVV